VKEIFSTKRAEIQQTIEDELKPRLAQDGILLRGVQMGKVDLPPDYRAGMEKMLEEELENEKMQYTLGAEAAAGEADRAGSGRRQGCAARKPPRPQATSRSSAAKAQEEAMKHVLPFKQKQIEQRQLEAEADKQSRIRTAEGTAQARRIRSRRRGRLAPEAGGCRSLPPGKARPDRQRADGARWRAAEQAPAADPEDHGRQAVGQGERDHRAAAGRRRLHRLGPAGQSMAQNAAQKNAQPADSEGGE